jgi:hypothetical protein
MAVTYKIGQTSSLLNTFPEDTNNVKLIASGIVETYKKGYSPQTSQFTAGTNYLVHVNILRSKSRAHTVKVYLTNKSGQIYHIVNLTVQFSVSEGNDYESFSFGFRPGFDFSEIIFEDITDSLGNESGYTLSIKEGEVPADKTIEEAENVPSCYKLESLLSGYSIVQLGIQADPGFIFFINGEAMKMGRRGIFEAPVGYEIGQIAVSKGNYIIDYKYKVAE